MMFWKRTEDYNWNDEVDLCIVMEDFLLFDDEAHRRRQQWKVGENDLKPIVINGRRTNLERTE